jgi:predicted O-methyltransferase YrrM
MIDPLDPRWGAIIGFSDIADLGVQNIWAESAHTSRECREAAHAMPSLLMLFGLARHAAIGRPSPRFVEIGTQYGIGSLSLLSIATQIGGHVWSMDIDRAMGEHARQRIRARGWEEAWTFLPGPSQIHTPIPDTDFLLVDGDHGYAAVCADMRTHGCAVRPGGIIALDDYHASFPGKVRWVQERWRDVQPLITIGPWAIILKRPEHDEVFRRMYPGDRWTWEPDEDVRHAR